MSEKDVREFLYAKLRDNQARDLALDDIHQNDQDDDLQGNVVRAPRRYDTDDSAPRIPVFEKQRDDKVVLLLNQLGERLIRSERERLELKETVGRYSDLIEKLEKKVDRQAEAEMSLRDRQEKLEQDYAASMQKMQKAIVLAERIEEAIAQQNRLARRIEQITQDKARMLRKLERIEEAVVETQTVLNAKSLVLVGENSRAVDDPNARTSAPANENIWQSGTTRRLASSVAVVALIVALSWGTYEFWPRISQSMNKPKQAVTAENLLSMPPFDPATVADVRDPVQNDAAAEETASETAQSPVENLIDTYAQDNTAADPETETTSAGDATQAPVNALEKSDDELVAMLNNDPDALAAALNDIAPGATGVPQNMREPVETAPQAKAAPAPATNEANTEANNASVNDFLRGQTDSRPLAQRIQPDASLPAPIKEIEAKAFEGVPEAQHDLAAIYTAGHGGVQTDFTRASKWFEEAAVHGIANARYNLGVLYHQGLGVPQDTKKAINWYKAAAAQNHPEAQYNLGIAYIEGVGTEYSPQRAALNFESAARAGILEAAYNLGLIYENGLLGTPQVEDAVYWYKRAADQGSPEAKTALTQLAKNMGYNDAKIDSIYKKRQAKLGDDAGSDNRRAQAKTVAAEPAAATTAAVAPASAVAPVSEAIAAGISGKGQIPVLPLDAEAAPAPQIVSAKSTSSGASTKDAAVIAQIQEQLIGYGLYPGPADGTYSDVMADAIRSYQKEHSLPSDGRASEALLVHMLSQEMGSQE